MNDINLYSICKKYGKNALLWRNKFLGLLPEVWKRNLFEKKGFSSIFEFASKLAGVSQEQVRLVLNLEHRFEDKPALHNLLVTGEVSVNKLVWIVSIASVENQQELAEKVQVLSQQTLNTLVKDEKQVTEFQDENGLFESENGQQNLFKQTKISGMWLNEAIQNQNNSNLFQSDNSQTPGNINRNLQLISQIPESVKAKLKEMCDKGIDVGQLLTELLDQHEKIITDEKEQIAAEVKPSQFRYIPARIKTFLKQEHGKKCSIPNCSKRAQAIHHISRFALSHSHDPHYLAPLCAGYHQIAHSLDRRFWQKRM